VDGKRLAQSTQKSPEAWLKAVEAAGHGLTEDDVLTPEEQGDEMLVMGLRLREGIDLSRYSALSGRTISPKQVAFLTQDGLVETVGSSRLRVTQQGFPVLDAIVADLAA
jgi:coproporphyrinogen III oxidase-like Fe-S oxidoreductase